MSPGNRQSPGARNVSPRSRWFVQIHLSSGCDFFSTHRIAPSASRPPRPLCRRVTLRQPARAGFFDALLPLFPRCLVVSSPRRSGSPFFLPFPVGILLRLETDAPDAKPNHRATVAGWMRGLRRLSICPHTVTGSHRAPPLPDSPTVGTDRAARGGIIETASSRPQH